MSLPNFKIEPVGPISTAFLERNIFTFKSATDFVAQLAYGRNSNKDDLQTILTELCGTCSTKHALLKMLADENGFEEVKLVIGIFKMNAENTIGTAQILEQYELGFIPEAHCYLKYQTAIYDFTRAEAKPSDFKDDLIEELEISANQISGFKVAYHKRHLQDWLNENRQIKYDLETLWNIREQCIENLSLHP